MITIVAEARELSRTRVRPGVLFLISEDGQSIEAIPETTKLAVDFESWKGAEEFVDLGPYAGGQVRGSD